MNQRGPRDERGTYVETDQSAVWGTALIVVLVLVAIILVGYFVWYAPVMRSEQRETDIRVTVPAPSQPQQPAQPGGPGAGPQPETQPSPQPSPQAEPAPSPQQPTSGESGTSESPSTP